METNYKYKPQIGLAERFPPVTPVESESFTVASGSWAFNSTFMAWSGSGGIVSHRFSRVTVKVRGATSGGPTSSDWVMLIIREGHRDGRIMGKSFLPYAPDGDEQMTFDFGYIMESARPIFVQIRCNRPIQLFRLSGGPFLHYQTGTWDPDDIGIEKWDDPFYWRSTTSERAYMYAKFQLADPVVCHQVKNDTTKVHGVNFELPERVLLTEDEDTELYVRSFVNAANPYSYRYRYLTDGVQSRNYPRYLKFEPSAASSRSETHYAHALNEHDELVAAGTFQTIVTARQPSLASPKTVLLIGDSLTANNVYPNELARRLTSSDSASGTSPAGYNLANLTFIGTQGGGGTAHEAHSGRDWSYFKVGGGGPFNAGFASYLSTNGYSAPDHIYALLTWNGLTGDSLGRVDLTTILADAKSVIADINSAAPSAKITLIAPPLPCVSGGIPTNYTNAGTVATSIYGTPWALVRYIFEVTKAYEQLSQETAYSSYVDAIHLASQVDAEFNMQTTNVAANIRNGSTLVQQGSNGVHPATSGYYQIADAVTRHFVYTYLSP